MGHAVEYYESIRDDRREWATWFSMCWNCRESLRMSRGILCLETHEMVPRSRAPRSWGIRANYFRACNVCHAQIVDVPLVRQLALKKLYDAKDYDLDAIRRLLDNGRHPVIFKEDEIECELAAIKKDTI